MIRLGPNAELFSVIGHDRKPAPLRRTESRQKLNRLFGPVKGDQIPEPLAPGKDAEDAVLFLGEVIAVELVVAEPGHLEVKVIDHHVVDARRGNGLRQVRLPDPFREPQAPGIVSQRPANVVRKHPDLAGLIVIGQHREDRLIEPAGQDFRPAFGHELLKHIDEIRMVPLEKMVENARVVQRDLDLRMLLQNLDERKVGFLVRFFRNKIEIPDRLMIMDRKDELYLGHWSGTLEFPDGLTGTQIGILALCGRKVNRKQENRQFNREE